MISIQRERIRKCLLIIEDPIAKLFINIGIKANHVTIIRLILSIVAGISIVFEHQLIAGAFLAVSAIMDLLDGAVARMSANTSRKGALLDSVSDRIGEIVLLGGISIYYSSINELNGSILALTSLSTSFLVSYIRARSEGLGLKETRGIFTRTERLIVLNISLFTNTLIIALWIISIMGLITIFQRFLYSWKSLK